jgi:hypothetical protein
MADLTGGQTMTAKYRTTLNADGRYRVGVDATSGDPGFLNPCFIDSSKKEAPQGCSHEALQRLGVQSEAGSRGWTVAHRVAADSP